MTESRIRKKLIEVALPLEAINRESARDKKLAAGHPKTLHYWWAPRPLAACRAVVFAALVDDPSSHPESFPDQASQDAERKRLFSLMERLVMWENRTHDRVLAEARAEIEKATGGNTPTILDPFCGRGLIPLEAQRLGLDVLAADLNPVAATIARTLIEIVPRFVGVRPVNPDARKSNTLTEWNGTQGFAADVEHYAQAVLDQAESQLSEQFPPYRVDDALARERPDLEPLVGQNLPIMGWIWARTAHCTNPACGFEIPLVGQFWLCKKKGRKHWIRPIVDRERKRIRFQAVRDEGDAPPPTKVPKTSGSFKCLACNEVTTDREIAEQGRERRIGARLMACIAAGGRGKGRVYLPPNDDQEAAANRGEPSWIPDQPVPPYSQAMPSEKHGVNTWADLFTHRQLCALNIFADAIRSTHSIVEKDAVAAGRPPDDAPLEQGGAGATAYADGITTFLGLVLGKYVNRSCAFSFWDAGSEKTQQPFVRQGIQFTWDFVEASPFSGASGSWAKAVEYPLKVLTQYATSITPGRVQQRDVLRSRELDQNVVVVTDPPYYANIGYADLSDFFYLWLRRALRDVAPETFGTVLTPKAHELAAVPHRFDGDKGRAEQFFVEGFESAFHALADVQDPDYPLCLFYAYRQTERKKGAAVEASTGWETMLRGLIDAGLSIVGTWPVVSESTDTIKKDTGSLATSIVLVCRKRATGAAVVASNDFRRELRETLPTAMANLESASIAAVDLAQAAIGPGMALFSGYDSVLAADGSPMSVREALELITEVIDEVRGEEEADFDRETRFAITWFETHGFDEGPYGQAETLANARNVSVRSVEDSGLIKKNASNVRLLTRSEMPADWSLAQDSTPTVWECTQHLIKRLDTEGEKAASSLLRELGHRSDPAKTLAYRLFSVCDRRKWTDEARVYNSLCAAWSDLERLASDGGGNASRPRQAALFDREEG